MEDLGHFRHVYPVLTLLTSYLPITPDIGDFVRCVWVRQGVQSWKNVIPSQRHVFGCTEYTVPGTVIGCRMHFCFYSGSFSRVSSSSSTRHVCGPFLVLFIANTQNDVLTQFHPSPHSPHFSNPGTGASERLFNEHKRNGSKPVALFPHGHSPPRKRTLLLCRSHRRVLSQSHFGARPSTSTSDSIGICDFSRTQAPKADTAPVTA